MQPAHCICFCFSTKCVSRGIRAYFFVKNPKKGDEKMSVEIHGTGLNSLCAIGKLHFYDPSASYQKTETVTAGVTDLPSELSKLEISAAKAGEMLDGTHLQGADRGELLERIYEKAKEDIFAGKDAASSVENAAEALFYELARGKDPYISSGSALVSELSFILLSLISDEKLKKSGKHYGSVILIAGGITKDELEALDRSLLKGIMLTDAYPLSEITEYAFGLGIPLITGCSDIPSESSLEGVDAVIDGEKGVIITSPDGDIIERYALRLGELASCAQTAEYSHTLKPIAWINSEADIDIFSSEKTNGIGMFNIKSLLGDKFKRDDERLSALVHSFSENSSVNELRLLLPRNTEQSGLPLYSVLQSSEAEKLSLILPSNSGKELRELRSELLSCDSELALRISVGSLIESSAGIMNCGEIAEASDIVTVDCDSLFLSLMFPRKADELEKKDIAENIGTLTKALEMLSEVCKSKGTRLGACGILACNKRFRERLGALGFSEICLPPAYILY